MISLIEGDTAEHRAEKLQNSPAPAWYYNENINISFLKIFDAGAELSIEIKCVA